MKNDDWFEDKRKSMLTTFGVFGVFGVISALVSFGAVIGIIYFIFWCLKHFGVIG